MKKHIISLLVLFLLLSTSLVGVSNQVTDDTSQDESLDAYLPHSYLARYNPSETIQDDVEPVYQNQISTISDTSDEHGVLNLDGGLMDSSWPMYCHDTRHTGEARIQR